MKKIIPVLVLLVTVSSSVYLVKSAPVDANTGDVKNEINTNDTKVHNMLSTKTKGGGGKYK